MVRIFGLRTFALVLIVVITILFSPSTDADSSKRTNSIFIGSAIFNCCQLVRLVSEKHRGYEIEVGSSQENFQQTRKWLIENAWVNISRGLKIESKSEYLVYLYGDTEDPANKVSDITKTILLGIPLTTETLGPDYQRKIDELHSIMTNSKSTQRK